MAAAPPRCSQLSVDRAEPQLGTAFTEARVLLVEQPGPWGPAGLTESRFDAAVAAELESRAKAAEVRIQAIRRPGRHADDGTHRRVVALADSAGLRWGSFAAEEELLDADLFGAGGTSLGTADTAPVYLVCTHARRDRCCAISGRPLSAALAERVPGRVWETSHLGGHRFATTMLVLPLGVVYGRVPLGAARTVIEATERGELLPGLLRGRIGFSAAEQTADGYARDRLGLARADAVRLCGNTGETESIIRICLDVNGSRYHVRIAEHLVERDHVSCGKPAAKLQREYQALSMDPA